MSMKQELETWVSALQRYDNNEFEESIRHFQPICDTSKILFNCGIIRATLGEHEAAVRYYMRAIELDQYLAIAYFQAGVSNFLLGDFEEALANFNDTLRYLRGNRFIDYDQLGLTYKLWSCEVLFNRGLCYVYLQNKEVGLNDMRAAAKEKAIEDHDVIDEAITDKAEGYTVFSVPVGRVFRPSAAKVKNVRTRDYLGRTQMKLCADSSQQNQGSQHRRNISLDDRPAHERDEGKTSYASTNLVRPGLTSRSRQQSEPPIGRNVFPPTPPPEAEKPSHNQLRAVREEPEVNNAPRPSQARSHSATRAPKPEKLELGPAAFQHARAEDRSHHSSGTSSSSRRPRRAESERPPVSRTMTDPAAAAEAYGVHPAHRGGMTRQASREQLFGAVDNQLPSLPPLKTDIPPLRTSSSKAALKDASPSSRRAPASAGANSAHTSSAQAFQSAQRSLPTSATRERERERSRDRHEKDSSRSLNKSHTFPFRPNSEKPRPASIEEEDEAEVLEDEIPIRFYSGTNSNPSTTPTTAATTVMISPTSGRHNSAKSSTYGQPYATPSPTAQHPSSYRGPLKSLRVKVHFGDDTRYLIISPLIGVSEFRGAIAKKFGVPSKTEQGEERLRARVKDEEGDMITVGDQEDLDMAIGMCENGAKEGGGSVGRLEVWVEEVVAR